MTDWEKVKFYSAVTAALFYRHRVRATFYHIVSSLFVLTNVLWLSDNISGDTCAILGGCLFVADYLAMMYDPHPTNLGPWFVSHFHRMFDDDEEID